MGSARPDRRSIAEPAPCPELVPVAYAAKEEPEGKRNERADEQLPIVAGRDEAGHVPLSMYAMPPMSDGKKPSPQARRNRR